MRAPAAPTAAAAAAAEGVPVDGWRVGMRVAIDDLSASRGTVRFVGRTQFMAGDWLGLELDKPAGSNNGTVQGVAYFACPPRHGLFWRPHRAKLLPPERKAEPAPPPQPAAQPAPAQPAPAPQPQQPARPTAAAPQPRTPPQPPPQRAPPEAPPVPKRVSVFRPPLDQRERQGGFSVGAHVRILGSDQDPAGERVGHLESFDDLGGRWVVRLECGKQKSILPEHLKLEVAPAAPAGQQLQDAKEKEAEGRKCATCQAPYSGFGDTCSNCRRGSTRGSLRLGSQQACAACGAFFSGFGDKCGGCSGPATDLEGLAPLLDGLAAEDEFVERAVAFSKKAGVHSMKELAEGPPATLDEFIKLLGLNVFKQQKLRDRLADAHGALPKAPGRPSGK